MSNIKAILFDLDGVLVSACEWHYLSLNKALKSVSNYEISRSDHETTYNGLPTKTKLSMLVSAGHIIMEDVQKIWDMKQDATKAVVNELATHDAEKMMLHRKTAEIGITSACITNSIRETAELMLDRTGQLQYMKFIVTNEDVRNPKPHPEGYIRAMVRLGLMPDECLIVEDSPKGLQAARNTGAMILEVSDSSEVAPKVCEYLQIATLN